MQVTVDIPAQYIAALYRFVADLWAADAGGGPRRGRAAMPTTENAQRLLAYLADRQEPTTIADIARDLGLEEAQVTGTMGSIIRAEPFLIIGDPVQGYRYHQELR